MARLGKVQCDSLPIATTLLRTATGNAAIGGEVPAEIAFVDRQGQTLDTKQHPELSAQVLLLGDDGKVLASEAAKPSRTRPVLEARMRMPSQPGPLTVRTETSVLTTPGHEFVQFTSAETPASTASARVPRPS